VPAGRAAARSGAQLTVEVADQFGVALHQRTVERPHQR
jgi:hypothetical protein